MDGFEWKHTYIAHITTTDRPMRMVVFSNFYGTTLSLWPFFFLGAFAHRNLRGIVDAGMERALSADEHNVQDPKGCDSNITRMLTMN